MGCRRSNLFTPKIHVLEYPHGLSWPSSLTEIKSLPPNLPPWFLASVLKHAETILWASVQVDLKLEERKALSPDHVLSRPSVFCSSANFKVSDLNAPHHSLQESMLREIPLTPGFASTILYFCPETYSDSAPFFWESTETMLIMLGFEQNGLRRVFRGRNHGEVQDGAEELPHCTWRWRLEGTSSKMAASWASFANAWCGAPPRRSISLSASAIWHLEMTGLNTRRT